MMIVLVRRTIVNTHGGGLWPVVFIGVSLGLGFRRGCDCRSQHQDNFEYQPGLPASLYRISTQVVRMNLNLTCISRITDSWDDIFSVF